MSIELVNHPKHYNSHPSGVECIDVIENMCLNSGLAVKHLWRLGLKTVDETVDLKKSQWYIQREIERRRRLWETGQIFYLGEHDRFPKPVMAIAQCFPLYIDRAIEKLLYSDNKKRGILFLGQAFDYITEYQSFLLEKQKQIEFNTRFGFEQSP